MLDRKTGYGLLSGNYVGYSADLASVTDYYPGGMIMPGRNLQASWTRFGYNGKENDDEVYGEGSFQDYGFRMYNSLLGRFISVDPLTKDYPMLTPYQYASNSPIDGTDLDGLERRDYRLTLNADGSTRLQLLSTGPATERRSYNLWFKTSIPSHARVEYNGQHYTFASGQFLKATQNYVFGPVGNGKEFLEFIAHPDEGRYSEEEYQSDFQKRVLMVSAAATIGELTNINTSRALNRIKLSSSNKKGITLKNAVPQQGPGYSASSATISAGKISMSGRAVTNGTFDYVVTNEGSLILGQGHSFMSGGAPTVQAAGRMKLYKGQVMSIDNNSGHYLPTLSEGANSVNVLKSIGVSTSGVNVKLYKEDGTVGKSYKAE